MVKNIAMLLAKEPIYLNWVQVKCFFQNKQKPEHACQKNGTFWKREQAALAVAVFAVRICLNSSSDVRQMQCALVSLAH